MHEMSADKWHAFFTTCAEVLGPGDQHGSWCAFTTFDRLARDVGYWTYGLPVKSDIWPDHIGDGGVWGQPFGYADIAHIVIPKTFVWERYENSEWQDYVTEAQDIKRLSNALDAKSVGHRLTGLVLEIKLY
jgi:hypothetical protein